MADFRFEGITFKGAMVHGVIQADGLSQAKSKLKRISTAKRFTVKRVAPRRPYIYKVVKDNSRPVKGEQKAYSKEEVRKALERLGYKVLSVRPKLLTFRLKPPHTDIVTFVRVCADLIREKLPFTEILQLMVNDIENPRLRESIKEITVDLNNGKDSEEAFIRQEKVLGKFTARMLGLASKSGNMVDIYESTATFLERNADFKKSIRSALIMPAFTLLLLMGAVIFYVAYIFPQTAELFVRMGVELPPMTEATMKLSDFLLENMIILTLSNLAVIVSIILVIQMPRSKFYLDKYTLYLPVIGPLLHKTVIEIFCRVFYALYSGAGESVDAIKLSAEACGNKYVEHQILTVSVPLMLSKGVGLVDSFEASGVFTKTALARFHSGAETGTIKQTTLQIANYYEKETSYKLKNIVDLVQIVVAMIIMIVMTALTLVSTETATIKPSMTR